MPINLKQFKHSEAARKTYEESMRIRMGQKRQFCPPNTNNDCQNDAVASTTTTIVNHVLELEAEWLQALKEQSQLTAQIRRTKGGAEGKDKLKALEVKRKQALIGLNKELYRLPNFFDFDLQKRFQDEQNEECNTNSTKPYGGDDIMFCIKGYEELNDQVMLTGSGIDLMDSLRNYMLQSLRSLSASHSSLQSTCFASIDTFELAQFMDLETTTHSEIWGCSSSLSEPASSVSAPSWMTLLQSHRGATYWDRNLPILQIVSCSGNPNNAIHAMDEREQVSLSRKAGRKIKAPWYDRLLSRRHERIQLLILTGPSIEADSRPLQIHILEQLKDVYKGLLTTTHPNDDTLRLRIRAVDAAELLPAESSRLVLEYTTNSSSKMHNSICLAYLSNFQDYASQSIRHGTTKESIHVLQGTVCCLPETIEWMLTCNAVYCGDRNDTGANERAPVVHISSNLRSNNPAGNNHRTCNSTLPFQITFQRTVVVGKNGKKHIENFVNAQSSIDRNQQKSNKERSSSSTTFADQFADEKTVSKDRIRGEALSSPFDFLPFYHR